MTGHTQLAEASGPALGTPLVTLQTFLTQSAERYPSNVALICRHQAANYLYESTSSSGDATDCLRWTYSQINDAASLLAARLYSLGVRRGMRVVAFLRNGAQWAVGLWAAALLGCPFVTINASFADKPDDAQYMLGVAEGSVVMVEDAKMANDLERAAGSKWMDHMLVKYMAISHQDGTGETPSGWRSLEDDLRESADQPALPPAEQTRTSDDDLAMVIFTSGTTSRPKGVMQTNRTLVSGFQIGAHCLELDTTSKSCNALPLFHIFGICWIGHFWSRGGTACIPAASFDPAATLQAINDEKLTHLPGPPSLLNALANHPSCKTTDTTSLRLIAMAAAVVLPEAIKAVGKALTCSRIACPFGMSEGVPITYHQYSRLPIEYSEAEGITTGPVCPSARVRICAPQSRDILQRGELGELHMGGPMVVPGYLGRDSDEHYIEDGCQWMVTGDQAKMDANGEIYIMGRYKDLIIRAGENISPASIEAVLDSMPGITSQVVGVVDEVAGEVPAAVLKVEKGTEVDEDAMHELLSDKLGTTFVPAHIVTVEDLGIEDFPRTESGKYQKFNLREPVAEFVHSAETTQPGSDEEEGSGKSGDNTEKLHQMWAKLLGMSKDKLSVDAPIQDLADSITVMRAASKIKRDLGQDIGPHDIMDNPTIKAQSKLLQSRQKSSSTPKAQPAPQRSGPPGISDISHMLGSSEEMSKLQSAFAAIAEPLGLSWEADVQDVLPVWDWGAIMLRGPRAQSWNHRHAFAITSTSTQQLKAALEKALSHQDMLRTLAITTAGSTPSHVIIRSSRRWYKNVIREVDAVETADDLKQLVLNHPELDFARAPGPLFRAVIAPIKDSGTSGLVYQAHHSCFDGLSLPNLIEDLTACLNSGGKEADIIPRSAYKGFADNMFLHRQSALAQQNCDFHVQRLQGLSKLGKSLWPVQRVSGLFKGNFADVAKDYPDRKALDGSKRIGVDGIKSHVSLPGIQQLKQDHGLSAPAVLKTSLALLNTHYTSTNTAIFTNYEAGRDWAFQTTWIANLLPNAMDVNGPTLEAVLNNITIDSSETCLSIMKRIQAEQTLLTKHSHAPLLSLQQKLGAEDGKNLIETMQRQIFNWLPGLKSTMAEPDDSPLKRIQMQSRSDVGILWNCGMMEDVFHVAASYDDAQLRAKEVEEAVERWLKISQWVSNEENWECEVGGCPEL